MDEILSIIIGLVGVTILIFLTYWGLKWLNKRVKFSGNQLMKVHERINLGPDKSIIIASVGESYMIMGITSQNITKIADLDKQEVEKLIAEKTSNPKQSFSMMMAEIITQKNKRKGGDIDDQK